MAKALIDNFTQEQLEEIVQSSCSMREVSRKIGYMSNGANHQTIYSRLEKYGISTEHFTGRAKNQIKRSEENVFIENSTATQATLRRWYVNGNYTEYKCSICGQEPFWNNMPLTLTLDHINGNNHDNRLNNLRWICPNCDRQLPTFAGRNADHNLYYNAKHIEVEKEVVSKPRSLIKPNKTDLLEILHQYKGNFTKIGAYYGVTDNAVRKWCKSYNLPYHSKDYKD